MLDNAVYYVT